MLLITKKNIKINNQIKNVCWFLFKSYTSKLIENVHFAFMIYRSWYIVCSAEFTGRILKQPNLSHIKFRYKWCNQPRNGQRSNKIFHENEKLVTVLFKTKQVSSLYQAENSPYSQTLQNSEETWRRWCHFVIRNIYRFASQGTKFLTQNNFCIYSDQNIWKVISLVQNLLAASLVH